MLKQSDANWLSEENVISVRALSQQGRSTPAFDPAHHLVGSFMMTAGVSVAVWGSSFFIFSDVAARNLGTAFLAAAIAMLV